MVDSAGAYRRLVSLYNVGYRIVAVSPDRGSVRLEHPRRPDRSPVWIHESGEFEDADGQRIPLTDLVAFSAFLGGLAAS